MLWPFDPLSNHGVFNFYPFGFETCNFVPFFFILIILAFVLTRESGQTKYSIDKFHVAFFN